jgi:Uma2 family endonuclease
MTVNTTLESKEFPKSAIAEERVVLNNISWETFERLLTEAGNNRNTRFHYLDGMLEIMSPLSRHEGSNRFIESLISAIAEELDLNLRKLGSLTMKRRDRQAGGEPDSCYYIQNEPLVRHKQEIDLTTDPPPDLVLEVDITHLPVADFPFMPISVYRSYGHTTGRTFSTIFCKARPIFL